MARQTVVLPTTFNSKPSLSATSAVGITENRIATKVTINANVATSHRLAQLNVGTPTFQRAPGEATGTFALESAMDELAVKLSLDPIELRRRNLPSRDQEKDLPWSSNHFGRCLDLVRVGHVKHSDFKFWVLNYGGFRFAETFKNLKLKTNF